MIVKKVFFMIANFNDYFNPGWELKVELKKK